MSLWYRKDLTPVVTYSWFPFLGTGHEHTFFSRETKNPWRYDEEDKTELERLDLARQVHDPSFL
jgi:hypothetical protein